MNECVEKMLKLVQELNTPLLLEVVKSIASLCNVDPYILWEAISSGKTTFKRIEMKISTPSQESQQARRIGPCWRCPACGKEFNDVKHLVNHILYFVRQRERSHLEVYRKIKSRVEQTGQTFTQIVLNELKC